MIDIFIQILAFVVTVLALVSVHEYGHYLVARALGIKVLRYAIGFGKPIIQWTSKAGIEYVVAILPLGGYVKLLDEREEQVPEDEKHRAFNRQPLWSRTLVVAAGPLTNIIFAIFAYWLMFVSGFDATKPIIFDIAPDTPAAIAGMQPQSQILDVDGKSTVTWQDSVFAIIERMGEDGAMTITTKPAQGGPATTYTLDLSKWDIDPLQPKPLDSLGVLPFSPVVPAVLDKVSPEGPAASAGLKVGDKIVKLDQEPVVNWLDFVSYVQPRAGQTVQVSFERDGRIQTVPLVIGSKRVLSGFRKVGVVGVMVKAPTFPEEYKLFVQYGWLGAIPHAFNETTSFFVFNAKVFKKMLFGEISLKSLGGPITIFQTANQAFRQHWTVFLRFLAMVSVMLAFINVIPVPGLDGGHLLMFLIEAIKRGPISLKTEMFAMRLGMTLLLLLMVAVTFNDIMRLFA